MPSKVYLTNTAELLFSQIHNNMFYYTTLEIANGGHERTSFQSSQITQPLQEAKSVFYTRFMTTHKQHCYTCTCTNLLS